MAKLQEDALVCVHSHEAADIGPYPLNPAWAPITIGRHETADLVLRDGTVSRKHAKLERRDDGSWWVVDLGSDNGTWAGAERVREKALADGELVRVGNVQFRFAKAPYDLAFYVPPARESAGVPSDVEPGSVVGNRYEIAGRPRVLGTGVERGAFHRVLGKPVQLWWPAVDEPSAARAARIGAVARGGAIDHAVVRRATEATSEYVVFEHTPGLTLTEKIEKDGAFPKCAVASAIQDLASALAAAHANGIVHGALRLDHVFVVSDVRPTLKLFGFGDRAPGDASLDPADPRTDVYLLGRVAYAMLTGRAIGSDDAPRLPIATKKEDPLAAFDPILATALAPEPSARFASMAVVIEAVGRLDA